MKELRYIHGSNPILSKTAVRSSLRQVESHHDFIAAGVKLSSPKAHLLPRLPLFKNKSKQFRPALLLFGKKRSSRYGGEYERCFEEQLAPFSPPNIVYNFQTVVSEPVKGPEEEAKTSGGGRVDFMNKMINQGLKKAPPKKSSNHPAGAPSKFGITIKHKYTSPMGSRGSSR